MLKKILFLLVVLMLIFSPLMPQKAVAAQSGGEIIIDDFRPLLQEFIDQIRGWNYCGNLWYPQHGGYYHAQEFLPQTCGMFTWYWVDLTTVGSLGHAVLKVCVKTPTLVENVLTLNPVLVPLNSDLTLPRARGQGWQIKLTKFLATPCQPISELVVDPQLAAIWASVVAGSYLSKDQLDRVGMDKSGGFVPVVASALPNAYLTAEEAKLFLELAPVPEIVGIEKLYPFGNVPPLLDGFVVNIPDEASQLATLSLIEQRIGRSSHVAVPLPNTPPAITLSLNFSSVVGLLFVLVLIAGVAGFVVTRTS